MGMFSSNTSNRNKSNRANHANTAVFGIGKPAMLFIFGFATLVVIVLAVKPAREWMLSHFKGIKTSADTSGLDGEGEESSTDTSYSAQTFLIIFGAIVGFLLLIFLPLYLYFKNSVSAGESEEDFGSGKRMGRDGNPSMGGGGPDVPGGDASTSMWSKVENKLGSMLPGKGAEETKSSGEATSNDPTFDDVSSTDTSAWADIFEGVSIGANSLKKSFLDTMQGMKNRMFGFFNFGDDESGPGDGDGDNKRWSLGSDSSVMSITTPGAASLADFEEQDSVSTTIVSVLHEGQIYPIGELATEVEADQSQQKKEKLDMASEMVHEMWKGSIQNLLAVDDSYKEFQPVIFEYNGVNNVVLCKKNNVGEGKKGNVTLLGDQGQEIDIPQLLDKPNKSKEGLTDESLLSLFKSPKWGKVDLEAEGLRVKYHSYLEGGKEPEQLTDEKIPEWWENKEGEHSFMDYILRNLFMCISMVMSAGFLSWIQFGKTKISCKSKLDPDTMDTFSEYLVLANGNPQKARNILTQRIIDLDPIVGINKALGNQYAKDLGTIKDDLESGNYDKKEMQERIKKGLKFSKEVMDAMQNHAIIRSNHPSARLARFYIYKKAMQEYYLLLECQEVAKEGKSIDDKPELKEALGKTAEEPNALVLQSRYEELEKSIMHKVSGQVDQYLNSGSSNVARITFGGNKFDITWDAMTDYFGHHLKNSASSTLRLTDMNRPLLLEDKKNKSSEFLEQFEANLEEYLQMNPRDVWGHMKKKKSSLKDIEDSSKYIGEIERMRNAIFDAAKETHAEHPNAPFLGEDNTLYDAFKAKLEEKGVNVDVSKRTFQVLPFIDNRGFLEKTMSWIKTTLFSR